METFGLRIDARRNAEMSGAIRPTSPSRDSAVRILVVRTNEELAIARQTERALN